MSYKKFFLLFYTIFDEVPVHVKYYVLILLLINEKTEWIDSSGGCYIPFQFVGYLVMCLLQWDYEEKMAVANA